MIPHICFITLHLQIIFREDSSEITVFIVGLVAVSNIRTHTQNASHLSLYTQGTHFSLTKWSKHQPFEHQI